MNSPVQPILVRPMDYRTTEYQIVSALDVELMQSLVTALQVKGWSLYGDPFVLKTDYVAQAMVR